VYAGCELASQPSSFQHPCLSLKSFTYPVQERSNLYAYIQRLKMVFGLSTETSGSSGQLDHDHGLRQRFLVTYLGLADEITLNLLSVGEFIVPVKLNPRTEVSADMSRHLYLNG
jgi:hypothetical protein